MYTLESYVYIFRVPQGINVNLSLKDLVTSVIIQQFCITHLKLTRKHVDIYTTTRNCFQTASDTVLDLLFTVTNKYKSIDSSDCGWYDKFCRWWTRDEKLRLYLQSELPQIITTYKKQYKS